MKIHFSYREPPQISNINVTSSNIKITFVQSYLEIEVVSKYKYLGFLIDDSRSFGPRIQYIVRKLKSFFRVFLLQQGRDWLQLYSCQCWITVISYIYACT